VEVSGMLNISVDVFNGSQALFSFNSVSYLLSVFVQIIILLIVFYFSVVIVDRIRFFLLGYFADKKYFDVVSRLVFSSFNRFVGSLIVASSILLLLKKLNVPLLSDTAVSITFVILQLIVLVFFLAYVFNALFVLLFKLPVFSLVDSPSVFSLNIRKSDDGKYVLYLNGSKVRSFDTKEGLTNFLEKISDHLECFCEELMEELEKIEELEETEESEKVEELKKE
jgi:ABC-type multidrug transport system fused ATPase/permease subunit